MNEVRAAALKQGGAESLVVENAPGVGRTKLVPALRGVQDEQVMHLDNAVCKAPALERAQHCTAGGGLSRADRFSVQNQDATSAQLIRYSQSRKAAPHNENLVQGTTLSGNRRKHGFPAARPDYRASGAEAALLPIRML